MTKPYLDQIDSMIDAHMLTIESLRAEVERLESAKSVIQMLRGNDDMPVMRDVSPKGKSQEITIRKIAGPGKTVKRTKPGGSMASLQMPLLEVLTEPAGMTLSQASEALGLGIDKKARNRVWYVLNQLYQSGRVTKQGPRYFVASVAAQ